MGMELRYLVDPARGADLLRRTGERLALEVRDRRRPITYVRTIYLDTPDRALLRPARFQPDLRLRVRSYACAADLDHVPVAGPDRFLELKRSTGPRREKARVALDVAATERLLAGIPDRPTIDRVRRLGGPSQLVDALRRGLLRPSLLSWYRRISLVGPGLRVTFDEAIGYGRPESPPAAGAPAEPAELVARDPALVIEVKATRDVPDWLATAIEPLAAELQRAPSKYRAGMELLARRGGRRKGTLVLPRLAAPAA
jgi:hypothetical protein